MKQFRYCILFLVSLSFSVNGKTSYFPEKNNWQSKPAKQLGFDSSKLQKAVKFAKENEYSGSRDLRIAILDGFKAEPFHEVLGPTKKRGGPAGLIIKDGYIAAQWGDLDRVDMTFSVTKSYLSTMAGLALDAGLIQSENNKVSDYVWDGTFNGAHNSQITWDNLLNQSSDWSGELFGIKDWADRPPKTGGLDDWKYRKLNKPGTVMEYNDVRVNVLAYSLLQVWRKPLPQVLKEKIMDPIDASTTWRWFGYKDAWVTVDGMQMKSVTGGGHSGGGVFVSTYDQARFGLLFLNNGKWKDKQLISQDWIKKATSSSKPNPSYGYMWWLNRGDRKWKQVDDESIFYAAGFGGNFIVVDQKNNLMIVTRWLEPRKIGEMVELVREAL
ncbi:MAG: beta-lactamase family protein [Gammaproteobacteria bacterium]|nr:beta-lactamase family protein [Gammaproteobacteria bacterium]